MIAVGVVDVGSPKAGKLGWAILPPNAEVCQGRDLDDFIERMADLSAHWPAAVGFEAPMFVPLRREALATLTRRQGEGTRPWSAGAGATVTTAALGVVSYTLARLRERLPVALASVDWRSKPREHGDVLFFEAFVSQAAKGEDHAHDALIAAEAARTHLEPDTPGPSAIEEDDIFSTLGAALALLSMPCLVVKPAQQSPLPGRLT
jgi:hypothetical protein